MKECLKMVGIDEKREIEGGTMKECLKMVGIHEKREIEGTCRREGKRGVVVGVETSSTLLCVGKVKQPTAWAKRRNRASFLKLISWSCSETLLTRASAVGFSIGFSGTRFNASQW